MKNLRIWFKASLSDGRNFVDVVSYKMFEFGTQFTVIGTKVWYLELNLGNGLFSNIPLSNVLYIEPLPKIKIDEDSTDNSGSGEIPGHLR